jgi:hypothetical protein
MIMIVFIISSIIIMAAIATTVITQPEFGTLETKD